jgi:uncharacterized protein YbaR (Trm112 family)
VQERKRPGNHCLLRKQRTIAMLSPDLLAILRCPLDPEHSRLRLEGERLICERCALRFRIQDGFPILLVDEAELPAGCTRLEELPCQRSQASP